MELDVGYLSRVGIVVLNQSLRPNIPDLSLVILCARGYARAIRMELDRVDARIMVDESVDHLARREVEELDRAIIRTRGD